MPGALAAPQLKRRPQHGRSAIVLNGRATQHGQLPTCTRKKTQHRQSGATASPPLPATPPVALSAEQQLARQLHPPCLLLLPLLPGRVIFYPTAVAGSVTICTLSSGWLLWWRGGWGGDVGRRPRVERQHRALLHLGTVQRLGPHLLLAHGSGVIHRHAAAAVAKYGNQLVPTTDKRAIRARDEPLPRCQRRICVSDQRELKLARLQAAALALAGQNLQGGAQERR